MTTATARRPAIANRQSTLDDHTLGALKDRWAIDDFRPLQSEAMCAVWDRRDLIAVLPTGSGKSLCYQAPAAIQATDTIPLLTLVISPLISLMRDQVDSLEDRDIPAACITGDMHPRQQDDILAAAERRTYRLLYVAPERAMTPAFLTFLSRLYSRGGLANIVIDEAHCVSHWGHDFRPDYRKLADLRTMFPTVPIQCFTATAKRRVRDDLAETLRLREPVVLVGDFDRPNLTLRVLDRTDVARQIADLLRPHPDRAAIIYAITRADVDDLMLQLCGLGVGAMAYHAGMSDEDRETTQRYFMSGEVNVIVATVAFGMGIDRPDVRYVIHAALPGSFETYHQEIGRAGRDGEPAECVLYWDPDDIGRWLAVMGVKSERAITKLNAGQHDVETGRYCSLLAMVEYANGEDRMCRHKEIIEHFGEPVGAMNCGACDVCLSADS